MIDTKKHTGMSGIEGFSGGVGEGTVTFYCVLYIDRFSNRVLISVFRYWDNAEGFRKRSPRKLHIEPEGVSGYTGGDTLWCSNEWGPGDVLSFKQLYSAYEEAEEASFPNGRPSPVKIAESGRS